MAHLKILAKAQPFIHGEIFKTENLSKNECTVEKVTDAFLQALKPGLESVAIYRNRSVPSRLTQPKE